SGYGLTATAAGLSSTTSSSFTITAGTATQLVFGTPPSTTIAGRQISPAVKVRALDALGNVATGFAGNVTLALGANPGGSTLGGTTTVSAVNGIATFGDLSLDKTSTGYWLTVTAAGLSSARSVSFNITAGPATQLVWGTQPGTITGGTIFSPAVKVRALDALGNLATDFTETVTVAFGAN